MPELEEVKEIPKKTFMQKPNSNQEKIEREEEELKELLSEQGNSEEEEQKHLKRDTVIYVGIVKNKQMNYKQRLSN